MKVLLPPVEPVVQLELALQAHEEERPVPMVTFRHVAVQAHAQVLSIIGLTGENVPVGFALGDLDDDVPHTVVIVGDPRDPALAARAGAAMADLLEPLVTAEIGEAGPMQLLVDSTNTVDFLHATTFRSRSPWLPGPYGSDRALVAAAERCRDSYALTRAILAAAKVPGADLVVDAVGALTAHLVFPLGGQQEAQQLPVLLACLRHAGAPVTAAPVPLVAGSLLEQVEAAETVTVSAAADPEWDNRHLFPALTSFKRLRNRASRGNQLARVDADLCARSARASGLEGIVTAQLHIRHRAVAEAFRLLRLLPELPDLAERRARADRRVRAHLQRGLSHERAWADFPSLMTAAIDADNDADLSSSALIEAVRGDPRVFALMQARGEAAEAQVVSLSPDGRQVELRMVHPLVPRSSEWWWLDDTHSEPVTGALEILPNQPLGTHATLTVTKQMRRLAATPTLVTAPATIRLTSASRPFGGRRWWPGRNVRDAAPQPWPDVIDFAGLDAH
jgi:hypothetical protein